MDIWDKITGNEEVWSVQHGMVTRSTLKIARAQYAEIYLTEREALEGAAAACDKMAAHYEADVMRCRQEARDLRGRAASIAIAERR